MTIDELIAGFPTTPFIFAGSGLTRRYYNLPNWSELLKLFATRINSDPMSFAGYMNEANKDLPTAASLIGADFNKKWYLDPNIRNCDAQYTADIANANLTPFKAEIATVIGSRSNVLPEYQNEVTLLEEISQNHITGFITTNYDCFLEKHTNFHTFVGQDELIFSSLQNIGEIYKIHGSIENPETIVIDSRDYEEFNNKCTYLAAKLMTIFVEYPIIFLGYSLSDTNIQKILSSIVDCVPKQQIHLLQNRFVFVDYQKGYSGYEISPMTMSFRNGKLLNMTKVTLDDYTIIYKALKKKKSSLPVKLLRLFKTEFYNYIMTNNPSSNIRVAGIDDKRIGNDDLVLAICKPSMLSLHGLKGIKPNDWYKDILLDTLPFTADEMLEHSYPEVFRQTNKLPIYKYLSRAKNNYPNIKRITCFDELLSNTIIKYRHQDMHCKRSIESIIANYSYDDSKIMSLIAHLYENELDLETLEQYLKQFIHSNPNVFDCDNTTLKTNFRRLIRIYDWLKFGNKNTL